MTDTDVANHEYVTTSYPAAPRSVRPGRTRARIRPRDGEDNADVPVSQRVRRAVDRVSVMDDPTLIDPREPTEPVQVGDTTGLGELLETSPIEHLDDEVE